MSLYDVVLFFLDRLIVYLQASWLESYVVNLILIGEIYNIVLTVMFETRLKTIFHPLLHLWPSLIELRLLLILLKEIAYNTHNFPLLIHLFIF